MSSVLSKIARRLPRSIRWKLLTQCELCLTTYWLWEKCPQPIGYPRREHRPCETCNSEGALVPNLFVKGDGRIEAIPVPCPACSGVDDRDLRERKRSRQQRQASGSIDGVRTLGLGVPGEGDYWLECNGWSVRVSKGVPTEPFSEKQLIVIPVEGRVFQYSIESLSYYAVPAATITRSKGVICEY